MAEMDFALDEVEARILGSLLEKDSTTPEYYPLTLNALVSACNQRSNREPVANYDEADVASGLSSLRANVLVFERTGAGMRVPKYGHRVSEVLNLGRREAALLCVLLLRGPQTPGELRDRTERMHAFADLDEVVSCLQHLIDWESGSLAVRLERQPGTKEARYAHLLSGPVRQAEEPAGQVPGSPSRTDRLAALEEQVGELREAMSNLRRQVEDLRRLFE